MTGNIACLDGAPRFPGSRQPGSRPYQDARSIARDRPPAEALAHEVNVADTQGLEEHLCFPLNPPQRGVSVLHSP